MTKPLIHKAFKGFATENNGNFNLLYIKKFRKSFLEK